MIRLRIPSRTGECNQTQLISFFPAVRNQEREAPLNHLHLIHQLSICQTRESCQRNPVSLQKKKQSHEYLLKSVQSLHFSPFRPLTAEYQYATTYRGIRSYKYSADFGDTSTEPELKCYCRTPTTCMKKGVHDVSRCAGERYCT